MIDAVRKVIAAYHDAPEAMCPHCLSHIPDTAWLVAGIHGTLALADAMEDLEEILAVIDGVTAWRAYCRKHGIPPGVRR